MNTKEKIIENIKINIKMNTDTVLNSSSDDPIRPIELICYEQCVLASKMMDLFKEMEGQDGSAKSYVINILRKTYEDRLIDTNNIIKEIEESEKKE